MTDFTGSNTPPLHTVQVSAGDGITEERKCHSSAEMKYGMPRIRSRAGMVRRYAHLAPNHLTEHARKIDDIFGDNVPNMSHSGIMEDIKKA